jgi:hypothetical protein
MLKLEISRRWHWPLFLAIAAAMLASGQDNKRQQVDRTQTPTADTKTANPATGGVLVFIDPATGEIREPEKEELQSLAPGAAPDVTPDEALRRAAAQTAPQSLTHPSGAEGVVLGEDQMVYSVVTIGPDGKLKMDCVTGKDKAEAHVKAPSGKEASDVR